MGVDLTLMPLLGKQSWVAHDMIRVCRRGELWEPIAALPTKTIPQPLHCYVARHNIDGKTCYGPVEFDPYGERLTYTTTTDLFTVKDHGAVQDNWQNRAVWAYLEQMPADWPVVLYWH